MRTLWRDEDGAWRTTLRGRGRELRVDGARAVVEELQRGRRPIGRLVIDDRPRQLLGSVLTGRGVRPTLATVPRGHVADRNRPKLTSSSDTPVAAAILRRTPRFLGPGNDTQLGAECISQCRDEREFWPHLARGEQASHARGVALDATCQLGFRYAQVSPKRVELPNHSISLGKLPCRLLIRRMVLRVLHPPIPAALMQANIEHLRGHGGLPSKCCAGDTRTVPPMQRSASDRHSVASRDRRKGFAIASSMRVLSAAQARAVVRERSSLPGRGPDRAEVGGNAS